jgi:hypothetical protein
MQPDRTKVDFKTLKELTDFVDRNVIRAEIITADAGSIIEPGYIHIELQHVRSPWDHNCFCSVKGDLRFVDYYYNKILDWLRSSRAPYWMMHKISLWWKTVILYSIIIPLIMFIVKSDEVWVLISLASGSFPIAFLLSVLIEIIAVVALPCGEFAIGRGEIIKRRRNIVLNIIIVVIFLGIVVGIAAILLHGKIFGPSPPNSGG